MARTQATPLAEVRTALGITDRPSCAICSEPVDPDVGHWLHKHPCPVPGLAELAHVPGAVEVRTALEQCRCDFMAHPRCAAGLS